MAKVRIVTLGDARLLSPETGKGGIASRAYLNGAADPLHLLRHDVAPASVLRVAGAPNDMLVYILSGSAVADDVTLTEGGSLIVEYGAALDIVAGGEGAVLLAFHRPKRPADARPGGHVHILPRANVPTTHDLGTQNEMGGGLHADAACPTCTVWLHENDFHRKTGTIVPVHSHSEHEIIFVTAGEMRLGNRAYGLGTALAVAADTKYGFEAAPTGLSFINFRAASPTVTTAHGVSDEAAMWIGRLGRPAYVQTYNAQPISAQRGDQS